MRNLYFILFFLLSIFCHGQNVEDDFEGNGTISTWYGDNCGINANFGNIYQQGINTSSTVLEYHDTGGQYANIGFNTGNNFDLSIKNTFTLKIYVPSNGITGGQPNQISLKLQDGTLVSPWSTQSEIIKPVLLNQWQIVSFNFDNDAYINFDGNSLPPADRTDFNRVIIQINGENNTDHVLAYIDDFLYHETVVTNPVFDNLVWSDEFDGAGEIDNSNWYHQTQLIAGDSWANGELQHYTNREVNSYVDNGTLKIKAIKETYTDQGHEKQYTSARLNSKFAFKYGRVEVRAKLPSVAGTWPAIWLLGKNINEDGTYWDNEGFGTASWPWCGEIDIMEPNIPKTEILGTWHWDNGNGYQINSQSTSTTNSDTSQNFHVYALEWRSETMKIYLDDILINEMPTVEPFNNDFFILLNVAMGGNLGGNIDQNFTNDIMEIDYVRVYQESELAVTDVKSYDKVLLFPNPVMDTLNIKVPSSLIGANTTIYSLLGQELLSFKQNDTLINIDLSQYKNGIYIIKFETDNSSASYKVFKK